MKIDLKKIEEAIELGYITKRRHWEADYWIYNYTHRAQFDRYWNDETLLCRGLILDGKGNVIARPFKKFFNIEEHSSMTKLMKKSIRRISDKLDGSLGISYFVGDKVYIATRGSFGSEQADEANKIYEEKYSHIKLDKNITYLFEIIYPENRVVVDYGSVRELRLIAMIDIKTGEDLDLDYSLGFPVAEDFTGLSLNELKEKIDPEKEGYVVLFEDGTRVKVKGEEYFRLHKLLTGINEKTIWKLMKDGEDVNFLIEKVPDEFYGWVKDVIDSFNIRFDDIKETALKEFEKINTMLEGLNFKESRKEFAKEVFKNKNTAKISGILFALLDEKPIDDMIWKILKPKEVTTIKGTFNNA